MSSGGPGEEPYSEERVKYIRQMIEKGLFRTFLSYCAVRPKRRTMESIEQAWLEGEELKKQPKPEVIDDEASASTGRVVEYAKRPCFGSVGEKCRVRANHFLVQIAWNDHHHYNVSIHPKTKSKATKRGVLELLIHEHEDSLDEKKPIYDGGNNLYTAGRLPFQSQEFVVMWGNNEDQEDDRKFEVTITLVGWVDLRPLQNFLHGKRKEVPQKAIQMLNLIFREAASSSHTKVSRSFFSPHMFEYNDATDIGNGIEIWKGYYATLRPTQMGLSLNLDTTVTTFYKSIPVVEFVMEFLSIHDLSIPLENEDRIKLQNALRGVCVEAKHRKDKVDHYKIRGITNPLGDLSFYMSKEGRMISVVDYFKERYNYNLMYTAMPCLEVGNGTMIIYLPIEVCNIIEGQKYSNKLNETQVTALLEASCERPNDKETGINMLCHQNYKQDMYLKEFGVSTYSDYVTVDAHVLPPPILKYHETSEQKSCTPSVGEWSMLGKKMFKGGDVENWACVNFSSLEQDEVRKFCDDLVDMCNVLGMTYARRPVMETHMERPDMIETSLRNLRKDMKAPLQMLIVILPKIGGSYGKVKRVCETELGIVTQCCLPTNVLKRSKQYLMNVVLKINVKVGGVNTVLEGTLSGTGLGNNSFLTDRPTIIIGADVSHPPPGDDFSPSIAAVVASMDWPTCTKYKGLTCPQQHRKEIISDLFTQTRESLLSFYHATGRKPERIIFYRDGVGEGQFAQLLIHEIDAIKKACQSLEENYLPPVTFVVVQKRHHTRLFAEPCGPDTMIDKSGNILPGTVVDQDICHPSKFDFFLCSHAGLQGTSKPAHYHVLFDENHYSANDLHVLTNNLCYIYARCTRAISIVAPVYYAHLAASRARHYLEDAISEGVLTRDEPLEIKLFPKVKENVKEVMFYC